MLFQSKWNKATYIVRPTIRTVIPGYGVNTTPGLRAEFNGTNRLFDSVKSQENSGWSDEERQRVETHLVKHKDFGNGIYLAAGEQMPEEYKKVARIVKEELPGCTFVSFKDGVVIQCQEPSMVGGNKCQEHREDRVGMIKGMVGSTDLA